MGQQSWYDLSVDDQDEDLENKRLRERIQIVLSLTKSRIKSSFTLKNVANAMFITVVSLICLHQCYSQINLYLKYPEHLEVSLSFPPSTLWMIPGITICNNNRIKMDNIVKLVPSLKNKIKDAIASETTDLFQYSKRRRFDIMKIVKDVVEEQVNITEIILDSPISRLMKLASPNLIKDVNCNSLWGQQFNCDNFRIVKSHQSGPCHTLFYYGTILEAIANGQAFDFNSSLTGGTIKTNSFDSHEIVEILVDFEPFENSDFQRDLGGKLMLHSNSHIGSIRDLSNVILPGNNYELIIQRSTMRRLPAPYPSNCYDYRKINSHVFSRNYGSPANIELDRATCIRNCVVRRVTAQCNCWPIEVPYFEVGNVVNNSDLLRMCAWGHDETNMGNIVSLYVDCYKKNHELCFFQCKQDCQTEDYKVRISSSLWPSREMFMSAKDEEEEKRLKKLEVCCSRISIKYREFLDQNNIMEPSLTFVQLVSDLGATVSALVGVSAVTLYRFITRRIFHCRVVNIYPTKVSKGVKPKRRTWRVFS